MFFSLNSDAAYVITQNIYNINKVGKMNVKIYEVIIGIVCSFLMIFIFVVAANQSHEVFITKSSFTDLNLIWLVFLISRENK